MKAIYAATFTICASIVGIRACASEQSEHLQLEDAAEQQEFVHPCTAKQKAFALLEIPRAAEARFSGQPNTNVELRGYSITLDSKGKYIPAFHAPVRIGTVCGYRSHETRLTSYYPVTRPGESNFVAIIKAIDDTSALGVTVILNPIQGFDYGPISSLTNLTLEQADQLWGKAIKEEIASEIWRQKTYKLESININGIYKNFLLDCSFKNGNLNAYRISGRAIRGQQFNSFAMDERSLEQNSKVKQSL